MEYFPLFLKLTNQPCLIVGGGEVAVRKLGILLDAGAAVTVVAGELHPALIAWQKAGRIRTVERCFQAGDERGQRLVVAATGDREVNAAVYAACEAAHILVNVVDDAERCRFIVPAIVDRSPLTIAISTGGKAPMLARLLRERIEAWLPHGFGLLAQLAGNMRRAVKQRFAGNLPARHRFWRRVLSGPAARYALAGNPSAAEESFHTELAASDPDAPIPGSVALVGAGPGNPDLLTLQALHLLQRADVVLYDKLVSPEIVQLARRDAQRVDVGKEADHHPLPQEEINRLMIELARAGKAVVRLKGGDPFLFGRGGEEIERLTDAGIPFQVTPGITAASGASCYAGIPLTHRDHAQSVTFVTGHRRAGQSGLDWPHLAGDAGTLVIYMGAQQAPTICRQLIAHGRAPDTPAAAIERATTDRQRIITGTLHSLPGQMERLSVKPPALIIVGPVVSLHEKLGWHEEEDSLRPDTVRPVAPTPWTLGEF
jgi:uroporphyrin-III C-methyltransferase/precorrin-2 dehydrogenase/sirohydrochlorin ferrochelatase